MLTRKYSKSLSFLLIFAMIIANLFSFSVVRAEGTEVLKNTNLVVNGDLESWDSETKPSGWTKTENITKEESIIHGGTYSAKHGAGTKDLGQYVINIAPGTEYTIEYWFYDNDPNARCRPWMYWKDEDNNSITDNATAAELRPGTYSSDEDSWQKYSVTVTAPSDAVKLYLEVRTYKDGGSGYIYYDDFSVIATSAPISDKVASVTATPDSSAVQVGTEVSLSTTTVGANIYYTVDGSEPTNTSTLYVNPIVINEAKVIKTIAVKNGMDDSDISEFHYIISSTITIAEARALGEDAEVTVVGTVTSVDGKVFIQDETAGINLYANPMPSFTLGDKVKITGLRNEYYGLAQIDNVTIDEVISHNNPMTTSQVITATEIGEEYEGEIVTINNVALVYDDNGNYNATDTTGTVIVDPKASNSDDWLEAGNYYSITGIVMYEWNNYEIMPVSTSDIVKDNTIGDYSPPSDYYTDAEDKAGDELKAALNSIIDNDKVDVLTYNEAYDALEQTDADPKNPQNVILFYTGRSENGPAHYNGGSGWNREHTWAKSHGDFGTSKGPGTDLHQLRPTDVQVNSARYHYDFDNVEGLEGSVLVDETTDCYVNTTEKLFEPRDEVKGDVARILFYMAVRYEEDDDIDLELSESQLSVDETISGVYGEHGVLSTLLDWHEADPVDDFERRRNHIIYTDYQNNRNPFIDHPEWVEKIWDSSVNPNPTVITISEAKAKAAGTEVTVEGIATADSGNWGSKGFYIQDDTGGIYIYQSTTDIVQGDSLRVKGTTGAYKGEKQIGGTVTIEQLGTGDVPAPELIEILGLTSEKEGWLFKLQGLTIADIKKANDYGTTEFTGQKAGESILVRIDNRTEYKYDDFISDYSNGDTVNVVGILGEYDSILQFKPRGSNDISKVDIVDTEPPVISHTPITTCNIALDVPVLANVTDNVNVANVKLYYRTTGQTDYASKDMTLANEVYTADIPKEELDIEGLEYYVEASDGTNVAKSPAESDYYSVSVSQADITGPVISLVIPAENAVLDSTQTRPGIRVEYSDESQIDTDSVKLFLDEIDAVSSATVKEDSVSLAVDYDLEQGEHKVKVEVSDTLGNKTTKEWSFSIGEVMYSHYRGQLHSHTTYSDGQGSGDDAFKQARDEGHADFFAITDHSNWFDNDEDSEDITSVEQSTSETWKNMHQDADKYNEDGKFVALIGYEMTWSGSTGGWGHINTFNTPWFASRSNSSMDLEAYYNKISEAANINSINQLNHPGKTFGDFADFGYYSEAADAVVHLVEVGNGEGPIRGSGYFPSYEYYTRALDKGWHVAPSNNQDNHKGNFVISNDARTVVLGAELTRDGIYDGIRNLRVYASEDKNMEINYEINNQVMGSRLESPTSLDFEISVNDEDASDTISEITIIADGGYEVISKSFDSNDVDWTFTLEPSFAYYYVKVVQGDKDIAVTAPIWTADVVPVGISKVEASENPTLIGTEIDVTATVYNNGADMINGPTEVKFYKDSIEEANLLTTVSIDGIAPGGDADATFKWLADEAGSITIYALTTINHEGVDKVFTNSMQVKIYNEDEAQIILVDGGHQNLYVSGSYAGRYEGLKAMMGNKNIILRLNTDELTADDLENISALIITDPASSDSSEYGYTKAFYTDTEAQVVATYINNGGNLIITSTADYKDADGEYQNSTQGNKILEAIGTNLRFNDDQAIDNEDNEGKPYKFLLDTYTGTKFDIFPTDIPNDYRVYSGCSVILKENGDGTNVDWLVKGNATTETSDADNDGDNTPVAKGNVYMLAAEEMLSGGKVVVAGSTFFSDFEISGDNQYANTPITEAILEWVAPEKEAPLVNINALKIDENNDGVLDLTGKKFAVEGYVTSESEATSQINGRKNAFFEVIYVQDDTGGITVFGVSATDLPLGTKVRVEGYVEQYDGDGELALSNETTDLTILDEPNTIIQPTLLTTSESMLEANEGLLVQIQGTVTNMTSNSLYVNDGSGEARVYVNGYIGDGSGNLDNLGKWDPEIQVGDKISAIGLASEDPEGHRLRVRNTSEIVKLVEQDVQYTINRIDSNTFSNGQEARVEVEISHDSQFTEEAMLIMALYDKSSNKMINYVYVIEFIAMNENKQMGGGFLIPVLGEYQVKVFVWDNFIDQNPLLDTPIVIDVD